MSSIRTHFAWLAPLLLLAFVYTSVCSAAHYGTLKQEMGGHHQMAMNHDSHPSSLPADAADPMASECCTLVATKGDLNDFKLELAPMMALALVLTGFLYHRSNSGRFLFLRPITSGPPRSLLDQKTSLTC